jgi:hypothetical protein
MPFLEQFDANLVDQPLFLDLFLSKKLVFFPNLAQSSRKMPQNETKILKRVFVKKKKSCVIES